jgi:hypothetical protein
MGMRQLHVQQFSDRNVPEPRELLERQEKLSPGNEKPEPMLRDVGNFNFGNELSKLC